MAPKNGTPAFVLAANHIAILASIAAAGAANQTFYVGADAKPLADNGYIEVNTEMKDAAGNVAARLTDLGRANVPVDQTPATTAPAVSFVIAATAVLPDIKRGGGNKTKRESKYPLKDIPLGGALFLPHPGAADDVVKKLSKQFGSTVAAFNKDNLDKYLTSRTIEDGKASGFVGPDGNPETYAGVPGIAIYHRPLSEKKVRAPKAAPASGENAGGAAAA